MMSLMSLLTTSQLHLAISHSGVCPNLFWSGGEFTELKEMQYVWVVVVHVQLCKVGTYTCLVQLVY